MKKATTGADSRFDNIGPDLERPGGCLRTQAPVAAATDDAARSLMSPAIPSSAR